jgi:hypothetical protein
MERGHATHTTARIPDEHERRAAALGVWRVQERVESGDANHAAGQPAARQRREAPVRRRAHQAGCGGLSFCFWLHL